MNKFVYFIFFIVSLSQGGIRDEHFRALVDMHGNICKPESLETVIKNLGILIACFTGDNKMSQDEVWEKIIRDITGNAYFLSIPDTKKTHEEKNLRRKGMIELIPFLIMPCDNVQKESKNTAIELSMMFFKSEVPGFMGRRPPDFPKELFGVMKMVERKIREALRECVLIEKKNISESCPALVDELPETPYQEYLPAVALPSSSSSTDIPKAPSGEVVQENKPRIVANPDKIILLPELLPLIEALKQGKHQLEPITTSLKDGKVRRPRNMDIFASLFRLGDSQSNVSKFLHLMHEAADCSAFLNNIARLQQLNEIFDAINRYNGEVNDLKAIYESIESNVVESDLKSSPKENMRFMIRLLKYVRKCNVIEVIELIKDLKDSSGKEIEEIEEIKKMVFDEAFEEEFENPDADPEARMLPNLEPEQNTIPEIPEQNTIPEIPEQNQEQEDTSSASQETLPHEEKPDIFRKLLMIAKEEQNQKEPIPGTGVFQ